MADGAFRVRVGDFDLAVRVDGDSGRPWVIFSNSLTSTYDVWDSQMPMFLQSHRVLRYDTRGHGRSSTPPGPYRLADLQGDVIALMDHFGIEKADLLGLSLGGMTALGLAIEHPERVGRVICCDARSDAVEAFVATWDARIASVRQDGLAGIVPITMERWFTRDFRASRPDVLQFATDMILNTDPFGYIACAEALKQLDYKKHLHRIQSPVLYMGGAEDQAALPAVMREMAELTPQATFAEINPGAHVPNLENPETFNTAIEAWLSRPQ